MSLTLSDLSARTGLAVLDHLERETSIPVLDGLQAQGDLMVVPGPLLAPMDAGVRIDRYWSPVPDEGVVLLRSGSGGNPHTLVADQGTCRYSWTGVHDPTGLALCGFHATGTAYLLHPEHGAMAMAPGTYVVRRQREAVRPLARVFGRPRAAAGRTLRGGFGFVAD